MRLKIINVGNQLALPLPEKAVEALQLLEGSDVLVTVEEENKWIMITADDETVDLEEIGGDFARMLREFIQEYRDALAELS